MSDSRTLGRLRTAAAVGRLGPIYVALGILKHLLPLTTLVKWTWRNPKGARDRAAETRHVAQVMRTRQLLGVPDRDCLQRSLLLYRGLARAGADPLLVVGFRKRAAGLEGHSSVLVDGRLVAESAADTEAFVNTVSFGRGGARVPDGAAPQRAASQT